MRRIAAAALAALVFAPLPAFAGAVTGYTGVDGFAPAPIAKGTQVLDLRVNVVAPGVNASPTLNYLVGVADGLELGIGSYMNVNGLGATTGFSADAVYPWVRGAFPAMGLKGLRTGYMVGADIPVKYSAFEGAAGASFLADYPAGPGLVGVMGGYKHGFESGYNRLSANVNYTYTIGSWLLYGEAVANAPMGGVTDGALRASATYAFSPTFSVDVNPALTFVAGPTFAPAFNPNIGVSYTF